MREIEMIVGVGGESFSNYFQSTGRKIIILTSSTLFSLEEGPGTTGLSFSFSNLHFLLLSPAQ